MKKGSKATFFVVLALIIAFAYTAFFGISMQHGDTTKVFIKGASDIRWGIDIRGGVDVTFTPPEGFDANETQMNAASSIIEQRLVAQNITDYEVYTDTDKDRIIVRFPWKNDEVDYNPEQAIKELGETARLTFRKGLDVDGEIVIEGSDVKSAEAVTNMETNRPEVALELTAEGAKKFATGTKEMLGKQISIWMDDVMISAPVVNNVISDGRASITGNSSVEEVMELANKINGGALPFELVTENYSSISATLGANAKTAMLIAGIIAYILICILMIAFYRLPGLCASISLLGHAALSIAAISGYFPFFPSFTLTLPGIAGIILGVGMGVDANVITAARIREELRNGKSVEGAIDIGFKRGFTAIFDGNITVIIVAIILMGAFGPPASFWAKMLTPVFFMFGPATTGTIYSFGYTLLVGVILNFVMGVCASRLMLRSLSKFKAFRKPWMYGGAK